VYRTKRLIKQAEKRGEDVVHLQKMLNDRVIPLAQQLNKFQGLKSQDIKEFALDQELYSLARVFGATEQDVEQERFERYVRLFLQESFESFEYLNKTAHHINRPSNVSK
jgi:spore coat polysaccharide biosynthesis predicted glycosyltransferase SpsG